MESEWSSLLFSKTSTTSSSTIDNRPAPTNKAGHKGSAIITWYKENDRIGYEWDVWQSYQGESTPRYGCRDDYPPDYIKKDGAFGGIAAKTAGFKIWGV
jgi:hypothetical protein